MGDRKDSKSGPAVPARKPGVTVPDPDHAAERAFDLFLSRGLHKLYDDVADQPVPDELLRLIEEDRRRRTPS